MTADWRAAYDAWRVGRREFLAGLLSPGSTAARAGWQKDDFRGGHPDGSAAPEHESRLRLGPFARGR